MRPCTVQNLRSNTFNLSEGNATSTYQRNVVLLAVNSFPEQRKVSLSATPTAHTSSRYTSPPGNIPSRLGTSASHPSFVKKGRPRHLLHQHLRFRYLLLLLSTRHCPLLPRTQLLQPHSMFPSPTLHSHRPVTGLDGACETRKQQLSGGTKGTPKSSQHGILTSLTPPSTMIKPLNYLHPRDLSHPPHKMSNSPHHQSQPSTYSLPLHLKIRKTTSASHLTPTTTRPHPHQQLFSNLRHDLHHSNRITKHALVGSSTLLCDLASRYNRQHLVHQHQQWTSTMMTLTTS